MTAQRQRAEAEEIPYRPQGGQEGGWRWCGGQERTGGKGEGGTSQGQVGSGQHGKQKILRNIKYSSNTSVTIRELLPHFSSLDILSPFLYFFSTQVKI